MAALMYAGFPAVTKMDVYGRGKQKGMRIGEVTYDELPKEMLMICVDDEEKDFVIETIMKSARSGGKGAHGDGKLFISAVDEVYTVRTGEKITADSIEPVAPSA